MRRQSHRPSVMHSVTSQGATRWKLEVKKTRIWQVFISCVIRLLLTPIQGFCYRDLHACANTQRVIKRVPNQYLCLAPRLWCLSCSMGGTKPGWIHAVVPLCCSKNQGARARTTNKDPWDCP